MKTTLWNSFKRIIGLSSLATYNTNASSQTYSRLFHTTRNTSLRTSVGTDSFWTQKYLFDRKVFNIPNRKYFLKPRQDDYIHFGGRRESFWDRWLRPRGLVIVGFIFGGCGIYYYVHLDYAPYTGRRRMIDLTRNQEVSLGTQQFRKVLAMEAGHVLPPSHPLSVRILRIGQRLAKVADQKDFRWEFVVVDKPIANAFCLPGGKVVVYTGLLPITPTDDALASVLAHEIGHAVARHGAEKLAFMKVLFIVQFIINIVSSCI